jgi:hypothetical protein
LRFAASYVTGSHNTKVGTTFYHAGNLDTRDISGNGVTLQLLDGVPRQITQHATPLRFEEDMKANLGVFAQDQWTIRRLTLNYGLRFDYQNMRVPENSLGAGPLVPNRNVTFAPVENVPNWKNVTPRLGGAYDVFGDGRTAVKVTIGKYLEGPNINTFAGRANPARGTRVSTTRVWTDLNGDFLPQCSFVNLAANGECAVVQNPDFGGTIPQVRVSDEVNTKRGYNWEFGSSIQRELRSNFAVNVGYYRRWYGNRIVTDNELWEATDFSPFCIAAPINPMLPQGGGYQVCGLYDIATALRSATSNVIKLDRSFGKQEEIYDGVDITASLRLPRGVIFQGGTSTGRVLTDNCFVVDSPQQALAYNTAQDGQYCRVEPPFQTQFKAVAIVPLPFWEIQTSTAIQSIPPVQITADYTATNAEIAPSLGRPISTGAAGTLGGIPLVRPGTLFGERLNQVDFRLSKSFRMSTRRFQVFWDLYNMLNENTVLIYNANFSIAAPPRTIASPATYDWPVPQTIVQGRIMKIGLQLDW